MKQFLYSMLNWTKGFLPNSAKRIARHIIENLPFTKERSIRKQKNKDYSNLSLLDSTSKSILRCKDAAVSIYGDSWNYQSDALRREVVHGFETCVQYLLKYNKTIDYLEIGSCQGLSMSIISQLMRNSDTLGKTVSIDPYFQEGYFEHNLQAPINKTSRDKALSLYRKLVLNVELIEDISSEALKKLISENSKFNLIYIDGAHEGMNPLRDLGLSLELISDNGGIILLDDHKTYQDVQVIKELCDRNYKKIIENWKVAAYEISKAN